MIQVFTFKRQNYIDQLKAEIDKIRKELQDKVSKSEFISLRSTT